MSTVSQVDAIQTRIDAGMQPIRNWQARRIGQIACAAATLFLAQLYLSPAQWFPETEPLHLALVLSIAALGGLLAFRMLTNRPLWLGWRSLALGIYCTTAVLSPIWSVDPPSSIHGGLEIAKHFLFFVAVINALTTPKRIRVAIMLYAFAAIVPGWGTFWNWWHDELLVEGFRGRWLGVLADPNHDAMALVAAVPLLLYLVTVGDRYWKRIVALAGVPVLLMGIIATHSRGGSLGLAAAVVVWALTSKRKLIAGTLAVLAAAGVFLWAPASFWARNETIASYEEDLSVQDRLMAWQVAERIFKERPLLGVGESAFLAAWTHYAPIEYGDGQRYVAHNLQLEVLGDLGVVGLLGMLVFLGCSLWSAFRARNGEMANEARAVFAALVGYLVCQQFSGYALSWFTYALCAFAACCEHWAPLRRVTEGQTATIPMAPLTQSGNAASTSLGALSP
ncbi:MAG: polymerase [Deltaproteobacteria bacterium]|nr:MAG: polymerase [Deltaproteobacteria bacterium]